MAEQALTDEQAAALSGTTDGGTGVGYPAAFSTNWHLAIYRMVHQILQAAGIANCLRVFKDGDLTFGVRAGEFLNGDTAVSFAAASGQSLTDDAVNYIYITAAGTLTVNTSGFPTPSVTPHLPLATIAAGSQSLATASGTYSIEDITDYRGRVFLSVAS